MPSSRATSLPACRWYLQELPPAISSRTPKVLLKEELVKLVRVVAPGRGPKGEGWGRENHQMLGEQHSSTRTI